MPTLRIFTIMPYRDVYKRQEVVRSNMAQKGTITVEKSGEVFSSVAGDKGLYQPIFSVSGLEGAVYEITAAEDIVTLDGTVRANKGEVVDLSFSSSRSFASFSERLWLSIMLWTRTSLGA